MSAPHSDETHRNLVARIPEITGRHLNEWFREIEHGPGLANFEERVNWLADEHALTHGYASAIIREHDKRRAAGT